MRRQNQIVIARMNLNVEDRHGGQAVLHAMPVGAAIEGDEHAEFGAREQQVGIHGIFANHVHRARSGRDAVGDLGERVAVILASRKYRFRSRRCDDCRR